VSAGRRDRRKLISHGGSWDHCRLTYLGDEWLGGVLSEYDPVYELHIIAVRSMQRQTLIGRPPQMGVRHRRRMPVVLITAMHVGERRLREAQKQHNGGRDCRQSLQDCFQCMLRGAQWSTTARAGVRLQILVGEVEKLLPIVEGDVVHA
jgi:hypothetical protein